MKSILIGYFDMFVAMLQFSQIYFFQVNEKKKLTEKKPQNQTKIGLSFFLFTVYENYKINTIIKKAEKRQGNVLD